MRLINGESSRWVVLANRQIRAATVALVALCLILHALYLNARPLVGVELLREMHIENVHWTRVATNLNGAVVLLSDVTAEKSVQEFTRRMQLVIHEAVMGVAEHPEATLLDLQIDTPVGLSSVEHESTENEVGIYVTRVHLALRLPELSAIYPNLDAVTAAVYPWPAEARGCAYRKFSGNVMRGSVGLFLECDLDVYHTAVPIEFEGWANGSFDFIQVTSQASVPSAAGVTVAEIPQKDPEVVNKIPESKNTGLLRELLDYRVTGVIVGRDTQVFINDVPAMAHPDIHSAKWMQGKNTIQITLNSGEVLDIALD